MIVSGYQQFVRLLTSAPLYDELKLNALESLQLVNGLRFSGLRIDLHCPGCGQSSTFVHAPFAADGGFIQTLEPNAAWQTFADLRRFELRCARTPGHVATICVQSQVKSDGMLDLTGKVLSTTHSKIGQLPTFADLEIARIDEYRRLVDDVDLAELKRAAGLAAHGIGIGAFVYLRRVFERLVENAHKIAASDPNWIESEFSQEGVRLEEKILKLRGHLPEFVIANRGIYGIISKGLHELSEEECRAAYPTIEESVLMMLDQVRDERRRAERQKKLTESIAALKGSLPK